MEGAKTLDVAFNKVRALPPENHLFCPKISEDDDVNYNDPEADGDISIAEKEKRIQDGAVRLDLMYSCSLILGVDPATASAMVQEFKTRSDAFLKSCATCVRNWHKAREPFLKDINQFYQDSVIGELRERLNNFDFARITEGLKEAETFIIEHGGVANQSTFVKEDRAELLIALYEAICCMPYLSLPDNRKQFNFVFEKIQERKVLKLYEILPSMVYFLFDENETRNRFAVQTLARRPPITKDDFEWAISDNLKEAIMKASDPYVDPQFLARFWQGFLHLLEALDAKLVTDALPGIDVQPTIFEMLLNQIGRVDSVPLLKLLLRTVCALIRKSPKAFWGSYGVYSYSLVAEQIFRCPAFRPLLIQSGEIDTTSDGPEAISWVKPMIESIPILQKSDTCDKILHHLLEDFATDERMSPNGKVACSLGATQALSSALAAFASPEYSIQIGSSTVHTTLLLNLTLKYKDIFTRLAQLPPAGWQHTAMSQASLSLIASALQLDAKIMAEEFSVLHEHDGHSQHEFKRNSSTLWEAFLELLQPGAYEIAKSMVAAFTPLITVEILYPPKKKELPATKQVFNTEFRKTAKVIGQVIERLELLDAASLEQLCLDSVTMFPLMASLVHGDEAISQAGTSFIKAVTNETARGDAVRGMLQSHFSLVLLSYTRAVHRISEKRYLWSPQFNIIRYSKEIFDSLCDSTYGILRSRTLDPAEQEVLREWWTEQWVFLDNAFTQTDAWSRQIDMVIMKDFCREAMDHARNLLAEDGVMATALSPASSDGSSDHDGDAASKEARVEILNQPRTHCIGLSRMLRLKDTYLVSTIVTILVKLLRRLREYDIEVPAPTLAFIKKTSIKNAQGRYEINTNLNDAQRAELARALGEEDTQDEVQILSSRKVDATKRQTNLDRWSKASEEIPLPGLKAKSVLNSIKGPSSDKSLSILSQARGRPLPKSAPKPPLHTVTSIREQRNKEMEEKKRRNAEAIAKAKALRAPKQTVTGEGSGLQGLAGVHGKDHAPQRSEIMVNSSSEDEDDSGDDAEFLAQSAAGHKRDQDGSQRIQSMKMNVRGPVKKVKIQRSAKDMRARLIPPMDVLHQAILEWDIFHEGNDPPNGIRCSEVSNSYTDPREYKETFLPLLVNEAWRAFVTAKDEATSKPYDIKVLNRMNVDKFVEVSTSMPIAENKDRFLSEGDIVVLSHASDPLGDRDELHCLARIWRTQFKNGRLEIQYRLSSRAGPILPTLMPQAELYAIKITNMTTIEREYASLESLQYYDLAPEILEAKPSPMLKFSPEAVEKVMKNYQLNPGQAKAILNAKENDAFTLVQGPPGTGKTKTIVAMVGALLTGTLPASGATIIKGPNSSNNKTTTSKKLLVCAPSNAAVDELVLRLKEGVKFTNGSFHKVNVLRLGRTDAINSAVKDVTLDELVKAKVEGTANQKGGPSPRELMHQEAAKIKADLAEVRPQLEAARDSGDRARYNQLQRKYDELKRSQLHVGAKIDADKDSGNTAARENEIRRRQFQQEILDSAQVLCATLSGSGHEMFRNLSVEFETVIVDEAAQCVELSCLIPLKYGCSKCILVGDPKQLPPTVLSQSAARYGYDQSLFVRMQQNHPDDVHLLDTQYRMHPEISLFPSQEFYEKRLLDGDDMAKLRHQPWHQSALLGPYRFFDVKGSQERGHRGQSLVNMEELKVAMQIYERFSTDYPQLDIKGKIGIITPYKAQLFALREQFSRRYGEKIKDEIEFNTTDAFQGRECEIIIFSCVRASPTGGIGFMTDIRRMNVGLTRAKSSLWILGDSRALVQGEFWNKLIEDSKARNRYTSGDVLSLLRKPGMKVPTPNFESRSPSAASTPSQNAQVGTEEATGAYNRTPAQATKTEDTIMEDAPPTRTASNRTKTPQLPQTYTVVSHHSSDIHSKTPSSAFGGINERGEAVSVPPASERPVIHHSGQKRPRNNSDGGNAPKKVASGPAPIKLPPSAPRAMPQAQDPAAMAVLKIQPQHSANSRPPPPRAPMNAPSGPSTNPQAPRPPPRKKPAADPFIKRKPNRPR
ncbi:SEN1 N terminal-domain-containing protein [Biscogniauxia mediterranea]|nr:SEN1 N terminal-domain-containing protein [Biscogniauxia mediterranea]